jgi:hypothetical protein
MTQLQSAHVWVILWGMAWPINPRKLKRRHCVEVSDEEWKLAAEIGRLQEVPVGPNAVLHNVIRLYLAEKARELSATPPSSVRRVGRTPYQLRSV